MKNFFKKFEQKMQQFMRYRYGFDELYRFLIIIYLIMYLLTLIFRTAMGENAFLILSTINLFILIYAMSRALSKNISKRNKERAAYLEIEKGLTQFFSLRKRMWNDRGSYVYKTCPHCGQMIRLKKVKGKHAVDCPKCKKEFNVRIF